jgi:hypothetical protein
MNATAHWERISLGKRSLFSISANIQAQNASARMSTSTGMRWASVVAVLAALLVSTHCSACVTA